MRSEIYTCDKCNKVVYDSSGSGYDYYVVQRQFRCDQLGCLVLHCVDEEPKYYCAKCYKL